jgi:hypothetical protein
MAVALIATAFPAAALHAEPLTGRVAASYEERLAAIEALGQRVEGSAAEAAAFTYIKRELRAAGLEVSESGFADAFEGYSTSRIVEAGIGGSRDDELAILVPVGSWVDSADPGEGAYGIALALGEAERLAKERGEGRRGTISLRFVFLGAEKRGKEAMGETASLGSRTWIARQAGSTRLAALYLNVESAPARLAVRSAGSGALAPYWLYEGTRRALEAADIAYALEANRLQAYRLGLASDYGPAAPYLEAGIPALELRGEGDPASTALDPRWLGSFIDGFSNEERDGFADTWDRHYFLFQFGKVGVVLREKTYVAFLVVVFALVASSFLIATVARRKATAQLLRRVPRIAAEIVALFAALALVFLAGKGIARLDALAFGSSEAWRLFPRVFAAARILFSFLLFLSLLSFLIERRSLTPNPYFYEFTALVCLAIDAFIFSAADLSASFYFMWALILVEISLAARRRWVSLVAYILMYAPILVIAGELAARPEISAYRNLIAPGFLGLLGLSALTLPFFAFTASPLLFFARPGTAGRRKAVVVLAACAIAVEGLAIGYAAVSAPQYGPLRKDLKVSELIDQDAGSFELELSGLRALGKGSLDRGGTRLEYDCPGDRAYLKGEDRESRIVIAERASPFLDRVDETVAIRFAKPPYNVDIALDSKDDILIYDCNLPFKVAVDGRSAVIYSGVNPGEELSVSLTVPASFRSRMTVTARYLDFLEPFAQSSGSALADAGLAVRASRYLGSGSPR